MKNKIDFEKAAKDQLVKNISLVRLEIDSPQSILKIKNHAERYSRTFDDVREKILSDDMYAEIFAKDPGKQNIYEKTAANYLKKIPKIEKFKNLHNGVKVFVVNGEITDQRINPSIKSVDFIFKVGKLDFFCSHKYTGTGTGSAQKEQYIDVRNFMQECNRVSSGNKYFLSICDGPYYENSNLIEGLNSEFGTSHVRAISINDVEDFISSLSE